MRLTRRPEKYGETGMKRTAQEQSAPSSEMALGLGGNGEIQTPVVTNTVDLSVILGSLQAMRDGDFSARLPGNWTGLAGKIADTFNDIASANQEMSQELR